MKTIKSILSNSQYNTWKSIFSEINSICNNNLWIEIEDHETESFTFDYITNVTFPIIVRVRNELQQYIF